MLTECFYSPNPINMRLAILLYLSIVASSVTARTTDAIIVDANTGTPLPKASVFDINGNLIGICSDNGHLPYISASDYPISISYVGYETASVGFPTPDSIRLHELAYELPEITIVAGKRDVLYMTGYIREYSTLSTLTDTVMLFREKMVDFMIPARRHKRFSGWKRPRLLASKSYYRFSTAYGMDSVSDYYRQHFTWSDWIGIADRISIPLNLQSETIATDTIFGKYNTASIWRKVNNNMYVDIDVLSDTTGQKWLPNLSAILHSHTDFDRISLKYTFSDIDKSTLLADNIASMSFNIESKGRGLNLFMVFPKDEPYYVNTYAELYITDKKYISIAQARKLEQNRPDYSATDIRYPDDAPTLQPSIQMLISRVDSIDHDSRRLEIQPDERLAGKGKGRPRFSIIGLVKSAARKIKEFTGV